MNSSDIIFLVWTGFVLCLFVLILTADYFDSIAKRKADKKEEEEFYKDRYVQIR